MLKKVLFIILFFYLVSAINSTELSLPRIMDYTYFDKPDSAMIEGLGIAYTNDTKEVLAIRRGVVYDINNDIDPVFGKYIIIEDLETVYYNTNVPQLSKVYHLYAKCSTLENLEVGDEISLNQKLGTFGDFSGRYSKDNKDALLITYSFGKDMNTMFKAMMQKKNIFRIPNNESLVSYDPTIFNNPYSVVHYIFKPQDIKKYTKNIFNNIEFVDDGKIKNYFDVVHRFRYKTVFNSELIPVDREQTGFLNMIQKSIQPNMYHTITYKQSFRVDDFNIVIYIPNNIAKYVVEELKIGQNVTYFLSSMGYNGNSKTYYYLMNDFGTYDLDEVTKYLKDFNF